MSKTLCGWCKKSISRHQQWYKGKHLHRECKREMIKWENKICTSCKINFTKVNPEHKASKMHKNCFELMQRRKTSVKNTLQGGTGSKK